MEDNTGHFTNTDLGPVMDDTALPPKATLDWEIKLIAGNGRHPETTVDNRGQFQRTEFGAVIEPKFLSTSPTPLKLRLCWGKLTKSKKKETTGDT